MWQRNPYISLRERQVSLVEVSMEASQITQQRPFTWPSLDTLGYLPKVLCVNLSQKCLHATVYCSTDHDNSIMEPTYSSNNKGGWEILSSHYVERSCTICKTMDSIVTLWIETVSEREMFSLICGSSILYRYIKSFTHAYKERSKIVYVDRGSKGSGRGWKEGLGGKGGVCATSDTHMCENLDIALKDPASKTKGRTNLLEVIVK